MLSLLYIDIATFVNETNQQMVKNSTRREQIKTGLRKLFEYDFSSKCDVLITDNTCTQLPEDIEACIPSYVKRSCFEDNRYGSINKGAGLLQKWEHNFDVLKEYDYIIHFEARLLLSSHKFFDSFFANPRTMFRWGDVARESKTNFFTGLFAAEVSDILAFCKIFPKEKLIYHHISIEYPMCEFLLHKTELVDHLDLQWFAFTGEVHTF